MLLHLGPQEVGRRGQVRHALLRVLAVFDGDPAVETGGFEDGEDAVVVVHALADDAVPEHVRVRARRVWIMSGSCPEIPV